jgi:hypothetical protein
MKNTIVRLLSQITLIVIRKEIRSSLLNLPQLTQRTMNEAAERGFDELNYEISNLLKVKELIS